MRGALRLAGLATAASALAFACVDLFHGTDFATLCDVDASACALDAGSGTDSAPVAKDAGPKDLCRANARNLADGVCARLGACLGAAGTARFGECSVQAQLAYDCNANPGLRPIGARAELWSCLESATNCTAVQACVFPDGPQPCSVTSGTLQRCGTTARNASTLVTCTAGEARPVAVEPCLMTGRACAPVRPGGDGTCSGGASSSCTRTGPRGCVGTVAMECTPGAAQTTDTGIDCATVGQGACVDTSSGPACVPTPDTGTTCQVTVATCDGSRAAACAGRSSVSVNCAALGLDCVTPDGGTPPWNVAASCVAPAGGCDPSEADRCAVAPAGVLLSCRRGARVTVDCAAAGLGPCRPAAAGDNATCGAP
jgi:hypothetical protein